MALLQILIPDDWTPDGIPGDTPAATMPLRWRLAEGVAMRTGKAPLAELPRGADVELIVPAARVLLTRIKLPPGSQQRLSEVVSYAVEDKLLGDPETVHASLGSRSADGTVSVAVIDRAWLGALREHFTAAGLRPIRITSAISTVPQTPGAWDAVWHNTHGWLRSGDDLGLTLDAAAGAAPLALQLALQEAQAAGNAPERIVVHAVNGGPLPELERWQEQLGLPVEAGPPWSWKDADLPATRGINLLQGRFAPSRSRAELLHRYRLPLRLAAGIAALYVAVSVADWAWLSWQKRALQASMTETFRSAFPDAKTIVDAPLQMRRNLADMKRARGEAQPGDFLPLLAQALPAISAAAGSAQAVQYDRGKLQLDLKIPQVIPPAALTEQLAAAGVQARVESVNAAANGALARLTIGGTS